MSDSPSNVAVIIPARNEALTLPGVLRALRNEGVPGPNRELLVVDDGSTDDTARIAHEAEARVIEGCGRGPAAARNLGVQHTEAEVLVFLDADATPQPGWLAAMLRPLERADIAAVKGRYVSEQPGIVPRFQQLEFEEKYARLRQASVIDFLDTGTAAYRREVFLAAGGFDESFKLPSVEDVELGFRLSARGARFAFADDARVAHVHAARLGDFLLKKARYGYFRAVVYRRFPSKAGGDSYTPRWMAVQIGLAGLLPVAGLAALVWPTALLVAGVGGAFLASCWPLIRGAWQRDRALLPWVTPLVYARAFAQGVGLALGLGGLLLGRR